jgi:hypothetical protein
MPPDPSSTPRTPMLAATVTLLLAFCLYRFVLAPFLRGLGDLFG